MSSDEKRPLGKILLRRKLVSQQELDQALRAQKRSATPVPLASQLVDDGTVDEVDALRALSEQNGLPGIDLTRIVIVLDHLHVVEREIAEKHLVLPVLLKDDRVFLAMADPHDKHVVDEIEFVTGKKAYPYIAIHSTLVRTIAGAFEARARGEKYFLGDLVSPETRHQLGLSPADRSVAGRPHPPPLPREESAPPPQPLVDARPSEPAVVVEDSGDASSRVTEVSTSAFGAIGEEVSNIEAIPDDLALRASRAASAIPEGGGKLVLVVDDEEEIRTLVNHLLTQRGHRVIEADRGLLALRLVKDHVPDLIILDAMLPELHGFDIARRIKGSAKYGHIPIIMVSAAYPGQKLAGDLKQNYGVEEYLEKPFRIASLLEA
ncbi:MAG: response regulator, partial [Polyangiaceae bacterium]